MKRPILFAFFFAELCLIVPLASASPRVRRECAHGRERLAVVGERRVVRPATPSEASRAILANPITEIEGVIPRVLTTREPAQMINPFAPPGYGSAWNLVVYTERDPYRTDNTNKFRFQPDGIRFLTIRPLW